MVYKPVEVVSSAAVVETSSTAAARSNSTKGYGQHLSELAFGRSAVERKMGKPGVCRGVHAASFGGIGDTRDALNHAVVAWPRGLKWARSTLDMSQRYWSPRLR